MGSGDELKSFIVLKYSIPAGNDRGRVDRKFLRSLPREFLVLWCYAIVSKENDMWMATTVSANRTLLIQRLIDWELLNE